MRAARLVFAAALALGGCTLEPHYVQPQPAIPTTWPTGPAYPAPTAEAGLPTLSYRDVFRDPKLQALIERALANNQDLRATLANVEIARAEYRIQRAQLFPAVNAGASATQTHTTSSATAATGDKRTSRAYEADVSVTNFEVDLFGRLRSLTHAAFETYLSTAAGAEAARLTLVGEVAQAYFTLASDETLLAVSTDTVESTSRTVALTQARLTGGVAPRTDLTQAQTLLDQARSDREQRLTQVAQDRNALDLLVGAPTADADLPAGMDAAGGLIGEVPAGLDSRILLRRPDVLEAEHTLRSANADIGAARAAFFPTLSLTGLAGFASPELSSLFNHGNFVWETEGVASLPIFAGGANLAGLARSKAQREQALAQYQSAIQGAFRDVANALARRGTMEAQLTAQNDLLAAATTSYNLEMARYREGIDPYLNVLDSQRTLYTARQSQVQTQLARAENLAAIYQAVGGDPLIAAMPTTLPKRAPR